MANCGLLLNDGSSFVLLNSGGVLLLNDNTCGTEAGVSESALAATGTGTGSFASTTLAISSAVLTARGEGAVTFQGYPPPSAATTTETPATGVGSIAWEEHQKTLRRREQWEADNKRMELLERKKTRISLDVGWLRDELRQAKEQMRPPRFTQRLQSKLDAAMNDIMAIEDELQELYIRMMS
jgi:hypothetical protein